MFVLFVRDYLDWIILLDFLMIRNRVKNKMLIEFGIFDDLFMNFLMLFVCYY